MKLFSKLWQFLIDNLDRILVGLLIFLVIISIGVMGFDCVKNCVSGLIGLTAKNKILTFLGIGMGGILFILQVLASHRRAKAMEETAEAQADAAKAQSRATEEQARANLHTEQGLRQERLKNAIEHLGHDSDSVRLGGAYELFHLAEDSKDLKKTAFDILCAHIRRTTSEDEYRDTYGSKPSEEVQSLLNLLFVQEHEVFKGLHANLSGTWLNGSHLGTARLEDVCLYDAYLQGAYLMGAHLQGALLDDAYLQRSAFDHAYLQGASFDRAHLQGATLDDAHLQGASLIGVQLQEASLIGTDLRGARSHQSHRELTQTMMELAERSGFVQVIRRSIDQESDLSGAIFEGGLSQKDCDSSVKGLSDEIAEELLKHLEPHIGKPKSNELPEDSGAITEPPYTREEAEEWIAEYEEAMSVPEGDS